MQMNTFITDILNAVDSVTVDFVKHGFEQISYYWLSTGFLGAILTLYILIYFYQMKYQDLPISEGAIRIIKFCFVFFLVTNWEVFYTLIIKVFTDEPLAIAAKLMPNETTNNAINNFFAQGMAKGMALFTNLPMSPKGIIVQILAAALVVIATFLYFACAIGLIIISKFYLSVYLAIAPYFIIAHLFDATRGLTQAWFKACLNYCLIPIFVGAVMLLATRLASQFLSDPSGFSPSQDVVMGFDQILGYLFCAIICLYLFKTIPEKTASLTASLAMAGASRILTHAKSHANQAREAKDRLSYGVSRARQEFVRRNQKYTSPKAQQ